MRTRHQSAQGYPSQDWPNGPQIKYETGSDGSLISPHSLQHQAISGSPWSTEGSARYSGQALPHHTAWGLSAPSTTLNTNFPSYAASVLSSAHDSSPLPDGISTPDSARSPMFSNAAPNSATGSTNGATAGSSNGGDPHQRAYSSFDHTPRPLQTSFQHNNFLVHQDVSPQNLLIDPTPMHQLNREPSHSPLSDYILVDRPDAMVPMAPTAIESQAPQSKAPKKSTMKRPRVASTGKARQEPDNFVSEYPTHTTGPIRRQSSSAAKVAKDGKGRVGGRSVGMHLTEEAAARAKQLRDEGSCWICCFQRDSVRHPTLVLFARANWSSVLLALNVIVARSVIFGHRWSMDLVVTVPS